MNTLTTAAQAISVTAAAEATLKGSDFKEEYIGIWTSELYDHFFDLNSGGIDVIPNDETLDSMDYLFDDAALPEVLTFLYKYTSSDYRADGPF